MGYLNNAVITVDAILTTKGREAMASNDGSFQITQFALADDEIDYTLYNPSHPSGSAYYGEAIVNQPLLEAFPLESQIMKYKLTTLPRGTAKMPVLNLGYAAITLQQGAQLAITPQTLNYLGNDQTFETSGYSATISDVRVLSSFEGLGIQSAATTNANANATTTIGTNVSTTVTGTQINLRATTINTLFGTNSTLITTLTVIGLDSGARLTIPVTITKQSTLTS
jgi:hypothetical protein|tara:strand:- start:4511 stop:5185 length:675 start_codon:yes stop_codon:yes gene_type:complete